MNNTTFWIINCQVGIQGTNKKNVLRLTHGAKELNLARCGTPDMFGQGIEPCDLWDPQHSPQEGQQNEYIVDTPRLEKSLKKLRVTIKNNYLT